MTEERGQDLSLVPVGFWVLYWYEGRGTDKLWHFGFDTESFLCGENPTLLTGCSKPLAEILRMDPEGLCPHCWERVRSIAEVALGRILASDVGMSPNEAGERK